MSHSKVVLVGNAGSGKSALRQLIQAHTRSAASEGTGTFSPEYSPTLGAVSVRARAGSARLCDIGCSGDADSRVLHLVGADVAVVFFSTVDPTSFDALGWWCSEVQEVSPDAKFVFVATHIDVRPLDSRQRRRVVSLAATLDAPVFAISSLTGEGVEDLTAHLASL